MIYGCSLFQKGQVTVVPPVKRSGNFLQDLVNKAMQFDCISIEGRLKLVLNGKEHPSVKIRVWLISKNNTSLVRIKGLGPFGVTVFDFLAKENKAWIYLPRSGRVYKGEVFFTSYGNIDVKTAIKMIELIANPWSPARYYDLEKTMCNINISHLSCFKTRFLNNTVFFEYLDDLSPYRFYSQAFEILFKNEGDSGYPKRIDFYLEKGAIKGRFVVSKVSFSPLDENSPLFDESFFLKMLKILKMS